MHTNEERIAAVHKRAAELEAKSRHNRVRILQSASAAAGILCVIALAVFLPDAAASLDASNAAENLRGSIFSENGALSFVVIGIISFLLGVSVSVFCFRLKKWRDDQEKEKKQDTEQDKEP